MKVVDQVPEPMKGNMQGLQLLPRMPYACIIGPGSEQPWGSLGFEAKAKQFLRSVAR